MLGIIQSVAKRLGGSNIVQVGLAMSPGGLWSTISSRSKVRCYFPKPKEVKRIKVHGWNVRISTPEGRRTIMRRILKGRHVLTH